METVIREPKRSAWGRSGRKEEKERGEVKPQKLKEIKIGKIFRLSTQIGEFDRVLGPSTVLGQAGLVPGSVVLLAGDPGVGKSTLLLQVALKLGGLYISGEESPEQIKMRSLRLGETINDNLLLLSETNVENILATIKEQKPNLVIVDSIQTLWTEDLSGTPGSIGQVRECALKLLNLVKSFKIPCFLIGHVTKEGAVAGPMVLAHLVDTVLYLEGERYQSLRLLRAYKNRFGPTDEVGVFTMEAKGMEEVENPSQIFLGEKGTTKEKVGAVTICPLQGTRPILCEIQALVISTKVPIPRRIFAGLDFARCQLLLAILQKNHNLPLYLSDVFLNVVGGLKIFEPAADLGISLAIASSFKNKAISQELAVFGEVGLLGELRPVPQQEKRIKEAQRLGFRKIITPQSHKNLGEVFREIFYEKKN